MIRCKGQFGSTCLSLETKHPISLPKCYFEKLSVIRYHELAFHKVLEENLNKTGFPKQKILFDKLSVLVQNINYMKDVLKTILITNLIHHLYEFLPIHVSRLRQRIMQAPYKLVIYGNIYAVGSTYKAIVFLQKFLLTRRICLKSVPSYDFTACIRGLLRFFRRIGTL